MKLIKSDSNSPKGRNPKDKNVDDISQGITMRLLEKYKPNKGLSRIKAINDKRDKKRVA